MKILCFFGFHKWSSWRIENLSWIGLFKVQCRFCQRCGEKEEINL